MCMYIWVPVCHGLCVGVRIRGLILSLICEHLRDQSQIIRHSSKWLCSLNHLAYPRAGIFLTPLLQVLRSPTSYLVDLWAFISMCMQGKGQCSLRIKSLWNSGQWIGEAENVNLVQILWIYIGKFLQGQRNWSSFKKWLERWLQASNVCHRNFSEQGGSVDLFWVEDSYAQVSRLSISSVSSSAAWGSSREAAYS